jgi:hypothetical protein
MAASLSQPFYTTRRREAATTCSEAAPLLNLSALAPYWYNKKNKYIKI